MTITLTAEMAAAVKGAIASGEYASNSEVIREALRDWQGKRAVRQLALESLREDLHKGLADIAAGRVEDLDVEAIVQKGKARLQGRAPSK